MAVFSQNGIRHLRINVCAFLQLLVLYVAAAVLLSGTSAAAARGQAAAAAPEITADAAVLLDMDTGSVIYSKNMDKTEYPASTTKIMTAVLALEAGDNDAMVTVSPYAAWVESTGLRAWDTMRLFDMVELMLLESDNAAATALGEYVAGGEYAFVQRMNAKALELGMKHTFFVNCNGMPNAHHVSSARDIAILARYAMQKELFRRVVGRSRMYIPSWRYPGSMYEAENTNELLETYSGCIGIKTGYTRSAGGCLVSAVERNGTTLLCVVLKSSDTEARFTDSAALLDYGFQRAKLGWENLPKIDSGI